MIGGSGNTLIKSSSYISSLSTLIELGMPRRCYWSGMKTKKVRCQRLWWIVLQLAYSPTRQPRQLCGIQLKMSRPRY